jgi:CDP-diacylglycerol--serine O-phosphatidyltransferase
MYPKLTCKVRGTPDREQGPIVPRLANPLIQQFLSPPNWLTAASLGCSTYALILSAAGQAPTADTLAMAAVFVVVAGVFDTIDGPVARLLHRSSDFGLELDTIADLVAFGVAPAVLAWVWKLHDLGRVGTAMVVWWVVCAAFRLARFNVVTAQHSWYLPGHAQGLPSTMAGGSLVTLIWVANTYLKDSVEISPLWVGAITTAMAFLMISSLPFRNFKNIAHDRFARIALVVSLLACIVAAVLLHPSMSFGMGALLYVPGGTVDGLLVLARTRSARRTKE